MNTSLEDSRTLADGINRINEARTRKPNRVADVLVATVIGCLLAAAALHFAMPCEGASFCAAAALRTPWWHRLFMPLRAAYLRMLIRSCVADVEYHQQTAELAPQLEALARQRLDELRVQLIDCDLSTRRS